MPRPAGGLSGPAAADGHNLRRYGRSLMEMDRSSWSLLSLRARLAAVHPAAVRSLRVLNVQWGPNAPWQWLENTGRDWQFCLAQLFIGIVFI